MKPHNPKPVREPVDPHPPTKRELARMKASVRRFRRDERAGRCIVVRDVMKFIDSL